MLRRAALPFHSPQGFNPRPRLVFALSLPLGVVGLAEVVELELAEEVDPAAVHAALARQTPPGLEILDVCRTPPRAGARAPGPCFPLPVPPDPAAAHPARGPPPPRGGAPRPPPPPPPPPPPSRLPPPRAVAAPPPLERALCLPPAGTARPEEVLHLLGLHDLVEQGAVLQRTGLDLE